MAQVGLKELLEAGVHFGHQTRRWNPKMRRFIHGERDGLYLIDLQKTQTLLADAQEFAGTLAHRGGTVLFVGTKKQARDAVKDVAEAAGMPYVNNRWLGGLLTNFQTISQRIKRLHDLERYEAEGQLALLPTRERLGAEADLAKLRLNLGGVKNMKGVPSAMFVIDLKTEVIAVQEAKRLRIPVIGLVDTNCDPDGIEFVVPGNDDAIRSCAVIARAIGDVVAEGSGVYRAEQDRLRAEAEERARREAEERARREAEEQAKREAQEQVKREAEEQARRDMEEQAKRQPAPQAKAPAATRVQQPPPEAPARLAKAAGLAAAAKAEAASVKADTSAAGAPVEVVAPAKPEPPAVPRQPGSDTAPAAVTSPTTEAPVVVAELAKAEAAAGDGEPTKTAAPRGDEAAADPTDAPSQAATGAPPRSAKRAKSAKTAKPKAPPSAGQPESAAETGKGKGKATKAASVKRHAAEAAEATADVQTPTAEEEQVSTESKPAADPTAAPVSPAAESASGNPNEEPPTNG